MDLKKDYASVLCMDLERPKTARDESNEGEKGSPCIITSMAMNNILVNASAF